MLMVYTSLLSYLGWILLLYSYYTSHGQSLVHTKINPLLFRVIVLLFRDQTTIPVDHGHLLLINPLGNMVMFHSYARLPKGKHD